MVKDSDKSNEASSKKMMVGFIWSCADLKFLTLSLLLVFLLATLFQFVPFRSLLPSPYDLRRPLVCLSSSSPSPQLVSSSSSSSPPPPSQATIPSLFQRVDEGNSESAPAIKRAFNPIGTAAYLFIQMGAYRIVASAWLSHRHL